MTKRSTGRRLGVAIALGIAVCLLLIFMVTQGPFGRPREADTAARATEADTEAATAPRRRRENVAPHDDGAEAADAGRAAAEPVPLPRICRLDVRVVDGTSGDPLEGAAARFTDAEGSSWDALADEHGLAVMRDVTWSYGALRVAAPGYAAGEERITSIPLGGRKGVTVELRRALPLRIVVRNAWSRSPVAAARVRAFDLDGGDWLPEEDPGPLLADVRTDETGRALLDGVPPGGCVLVVTGDGLETTHTGLRRNPGYDATRTTTLWTSPAAGVHGRIVDADGQGVPGAVVRVSWGRSSAFTPAFRIPGRNTVLGGPEGSSTTELWRPLSTTSDADGYYRIDGVRRGPPFFVRDLTVRHRPISDTVRLRLLRDSEDIEQDLVVHGMPDEPLDGDVDFEFPELDSEIGEAVLRGRVVDSDGDGLGEARVWIAGRTHATYSEPDGAFEIRGVPAGPCTVRAGKPLHTRASQETSAPHDGILLSVSALPDDSVEEFGGADRHVLRFTAVLRGEGPPPPALQLFADFGITTTQWSGSGRRRSFRVTVHRSRRPRPTVHIAGVGVLPREITLPAARGGEIDLGEVTLDTGRVVRGLVVDDTGAPVEGAQVSVLPAAAQVSGPPGLMSGAAVTGRDGRFVAGGLAPGRHTVRAGSERHAGGSTEFDLDDDGHPVRVTLRRLVSVRVIVRDEEGLPIQDARVRVRAQERGDGTRTDRSGAAHVWLPPGRHSIGAYEPSTAGLATPSVVDLELGNASTEVVLTIPREAARK